MQQWLAVSSWSDPREVKPKHTEYELCDRTIMMQDWTVHKDSTAHRNAKEHDSEARENKASVVGGVSSAIPDSLIGGLTNPSSSGILRASPNT